jgi:hypothetical protein
MVKSQVDIKKLRGIASVIPILAILVLALVPAASAYTATLVAPADINNVHNGDRVSIRVDNLIGADIFQLNISSTDLNTTGGTFSIDNFAMPFGFVNGTASTSLVGSNINASGLRLIVDRADGVTINQRNQTSSNPYRIFLTHDILKTSYNMSITGFPQSASDVIIDFSVRGNVNNPNIPSFMNFTIRQLNSGHLRLTVNDGTTDQLNTTLAVTPNTGAMIGVFRPGNGNWYFDTTRTGVVNKTFQFGTTGDIPVVGDWDGNGIIDSGVFRPASGTWFLDTSKTGVVAYSFRFGKSGDIPVVGDWDGNGISDAGVFRPDSGTWYFDTTKTGVVASSFHFGKSGDTPVVGDWNGNGVSDAGVFRSDSGTWYQDTTKTGVVASSFHFGKSGDTPVVGDWDGNGVSDAGIFRSANGNWYEDTTNTGTVSATFHFGTSGDVPESGLWV